MSSDRHHRQRILPQVGPAGQARLRAGSVLVVGVGGLGSPAALYLAAAGVGRIGLLDDQVLEVSNLQRQTLFVDGDRGRPKVEAGRDRLLALDPELQVDAMRDTFRPANAAGMLAAYDLVIDGTDAFETKFLLNDAAIMMKRPLVHGAVLQWTGQVTTVLSGGPCLRCLFGNPPDPASILSCEEAGILGPVTGMVGTLQAEEALKLLLGAGDPLSGRLWQHDGLRGETRVVGFPKDPSCPVCSAHPVITDLSHYADQVSPRGHVLASAG